MIAFCLVSVGGSEAQVQLTAADISQIEKRLPRNKVVNVLKIGQAVSLTTKQAEELLTGLKGLRRKDLEERYYRFPSHPDRLSNTKLMVGQVIAFLELGLRPNTRRRRFRERRR